MSIWGKIFGGTSGFVVGGPLGGLLGIFAGHAIDKFNRRKIPESVAVRQVNFTIGVIALSAKMAKADGIVSHQELDAFKKGLIINQNELNNVEKVWNFAKQSVHGFESYARQLAQLFKPNISETFLRNSVSSIVIRPSDFAIENSKCIRFSRIEEFGLNNLASCLA